MKVECIHGYFKFSETNAGQISHFMSLFGFEIERSGDHFTFTDLVDAPKYSIAGGTFLDAPTIKTFEGEPWEVMRANALVYDFTTGLVVPISSIARNIEIDLSGNIYVTTGMILPGSLTDDGVRVMDYSAFFLFDRMNFKYTEVGGE